MSDDPQSLRDELCASGATAPRIWRGSGPEDRLSIAVNRFLHRALVPPFYAVAIPDSDHGTRSDLQRIRDSNKGQVASQLDWTVWQAPGLARQMELKRGYNKLTEGQKQTVATLTACGSPPVIAWSLREVHDGLLVAGFRFLDNWRTTLAHMEAQLEAWDRAAAAIKSGVTVRKPSKPRGPRTRPGLSWLRP